MAIHELLQSNKVALDKLYDEHVDTVRALQDILNDDILPGLVDELQLDQQDEERARGWLRDTASVFRILKRHKFIMSFSLESLRETLSWRVKNLPASTFNPRVLSLQCLPVGSHDPFRRPILFMHISSLLQTCEDVRPSLIQNMELLRLHLQRMNSQDGIARPILQYVALLDVKGLSLKNVQHLDLLTWFIYELLPRYPGMLAAVFILNYTWTYSGMWNVAKRALPASALSRVFFPSQTELTDYFAPSSLPTEFGGDLPPLSDLEDPLHAYLLTPDATAIFVGCSNPTAPPSTFVAPARQPSASAISPLNPFYGYPVSFDSARPTLRHGRRRKRDLLRTLARLWWVRWRAQVTGSLVLLLAMLVVLLARRHRPLQARWPWRWKFLSASAYTLGSAIAATRAIDAAARARDALEFVLPSGPM